MNQESRRLVALDGRDLGTTVETQVQRDALIDAMAKLGRRLRPDFDVERFRANAGYAGLLVAQ